MIAPCEKNQRHQYLVLAWPFFHALWRAMFRYNSLTEGLLLRRKSERPAAMIVLSFRRTHSTLNDGHLRAFAPQALHRRVSRIIDYQSN
jgi:hypothetical protein